MFKKILRLIIPAAFAVYIYWPYHVSRQFAEALNSRDPAQIDQLVDWGEVNSSNDADRLARAKAYIDKKYHGQSGHEAALAGLGPRSGPTDSQSLLAFLKLEKAAHEEPVEIESRTWTSPREVTVRMHPAAAGVTFRFGSLSGWKFAGVAQPPQIDGDTEERIQKMLGPAR